MKKTLFLLISILTLVSLPVLLCACGDGGKSGNSKGDSAEEDKDINISVYIDLSDRLTRNLTPTQKDRDTEIVSYIIDKFTKQSSGQKLLQSGNKMQVFFYPTPQNPNISALAAKLNVDLGKTDLKQRRNRLQSMETEFKHSLEQIYNQTLKNANWQGCDIWGFFSGKHVDKYCIKKGARNILVILTDGFIYDVNNKQQNAKKDSCSFLTHNNLGKQHLWVKRDGLEDLEVLLLELNPYNPTQQDTLEDELKQWFKGMGVEKVETAVTDMPINTQRVIDNFLGF